MHDLIKVGVSRERERERERERRFGLVDPKVRQECNIPMKFADLIKN